VLYKRREYRIERGLEDYHPNDPEEDDHQDHGTPIVSDDE